MNRKILPLTVVAFILLSASQSFAVGRDTAKADSFHISEEVTHYPSEENTTELEIKVNTNERARILNFNIRNIGDSDAINFVWNVSFCNGYILYGRTFSDSESKLLSNNNVTIWIEPYKGYLMEASRVVVGFGKPKMTISANAENAEKVEKTVETFLFLTFCKREIPRL